MTRIWIRIWITSNLPPLPMVRRLWDTRIPFLRVNRAVYVPSLCIGCDKTHRRACFAVQTHLRNMISKSTSLTQPPAPALLRQSKANLDFRMISRLWMAISQRLGKIFSNFQKFVFSKNFNLDAGSIFRSLRAICHERSRKNCHFAR